MEKKLIVYKPLGFTPLQAINKLKDKYPEYKDEKISYAGRLDPMAEGLLLLLIGDENKKRNQYEEMEKDYEFEVLFGVSTDTYDILGLITDQKLDEKTDIEDHVLKILPKFCGKKLQPFPAFSSKPVKSRPLYWWARENRLSEIEIPTRDINISEIKYLQTSRISAKKIEKSIDERVKFVNGDFRQEEILASWEDFFEKNKRSEFCVMKFSAIVSSGTYIRSLAKRMGEKIGMPSLAFSIKRTRVGEFDLSNSIKLD